VPFGSTTPFTLSVSMGIVVHRIGDRVVVGVASETPEALIRLPMRLDSLASMASDSANAKEWAMNTLPASPPAVSHYRLVELLGRGAMREVWPAQVTQLPRNAPDDGRIHYASPRERPEFIRLFGRAAGP
jgi:hypothetical protein